VHRTLAENSVVKIAVIGTRGQLSRSLLEAGEARGIKVVALGRPVLDLADCLSVNRALDASSVDIVVNAAAYTAVDQAESDASAAFAINAAGAEHVAAACARLALPLIHISTDYVFDGTKPSPYLENDPTGPTTVYGRSKCEGEQQVARICPHHIILRTAWLHSPFGHNFVKTMLRLAGEREQISVVDDQFGSPTYAPHLADVILAMADRLATGNADSQWGIYHAAGKGYASWYELAEATFQASRALGGPSAKVIRILSSRRAAAATRPMNSRLDGGKLARSFDLRLPHWRTGVACGVIRLISMIQPH